MMLRDHRGWRYLGNLDLHVWALGNAEFEGPELVAMAEFLAEWRSTVSAHKMLDMRGAHGPMLCDLMAAVVRYRDRADLTGLEDFLATQDLGLRHRIAVLYTEIVRMTILRSQSIDHPF